MADQDGDAKTQTFHIRMGAERPIGSGRKSDRKSERPRLPASTPLFNRAKSDMVSYEDLLVAQYLDDLKRQRTEPLKEKQVKNPSPYLQRLPHTHLRYGKYKRRPMSATVTGYRPSSGKPKIDAKFIADSNLWDPATPRDLRRLRPASAPVRRMRPHSGVSIRSRPPSGPKSMYRRQPHVIKAFAFPNGSRDNFVHLAAPNIKILLEFATEKLGLPFAGRRIFLEDGVEIFKEHDIPPEGDIYISMGEKFKDPYHSTKRSMVVRNSSVWTLSGVILPDKGRKKGTKARMSKRMRALCENKKVRIMVYKNGSSTEPNEVVADLKNIDDFFMCCTSKLGLRSHARIAYDWDGNEITDLSETPILDDSIVHQGKTPFLGPLWISTGEGFSPSGTLGFLYMIQNALKDKLKAAKLHKADIDFALDNEKEKVINRVVLSMTADELYESSEKVEDEIDKYEDALSMINDKLNALKEDALKEEEEGMRYRMAHIQELSSDDRLVGTSGLKLKVYENGRADGEFIYYFNLREAIKGTGDGTKALQRLLDELSSTRFTARANRNLNAVATNLYDKDGREITGVTNIEKEQSVWVSFGEPYICPFTYALQLFLDKATPVTDSNGTQRIIREGLSDMDELVKDSSKWDATIGFPALYEVSETHDQEYDPGKVAYLLEIAEVDSKNHFLLLKEKHTLALYPEIGIAEKKHVKNQIFVHTESGVIYCKAAPQLCLAVSDNKVEVKMFNKDINIDGFAVCMQKRMVGNPSQIWRCMPDATIVSEAYPTLLLTFLGNKRSDMVDEAYAEHVEAETKKGSFSYLVVADPLPKKEMAAQRFAFKQERFDNLGQWKYTEASNSEWNKQALSWPVRENGELNKDYDWPMEGYLLTNAPPIRKSGKKSGLSGMTPVRLRVLKNGDRNWESAVSVVGPDLTNMMKVNAKTEQVNKRKETKNSQMATPGDYEDIDIDLHCMDKTVIELEFQMFLAHCTHLLDLPFAARRLFDYHGKELFSIQNLDRDTIVYASCGEEWSDPKLTREEQKRRFVLSQLSSDVLKIQQYCAMRNPENYVLEVNGPMAPKSGLVVNTQWNMENEAHDRGDGASTKRSIAEQQQFKGGNEEEDGEQSVRDSGDISAHQRSHLKSEERMNTLKWPWEKLVNVNNSMDTEDPEANKYTDRDLYEKFKPQTPSRASRDTLQRFEFEDGYIAVVANKTMVLSVSESEGRVIDVVLAKRRPDDINQRWLIRENGEIRARNNQHLVLTVSMPATASDEESSLSISDCPVTLQSRVTSTFGKAHQKWRYDAETGFIHAFYTDLPDKEITAANRADVCTYSIAQVADIDQPGYIVDMQDLRGKVQKHKVCMSCARAMRGRYKVQRLPPSTKFHCAMGDAKKLKIRQVGSFKVLNNKVDLSTYEADLTLSYWQDMLINLRQQTNVHAIAKEINAAKAIRTVKVMAYKNGEGRLRKGEIICGSSIEGILVQCAHRLGMTNAARRMYLEDGNLVLDIDELVRYAVENYKTEMINMILLKKGEEAATQNNEEGGEEDDAQRLQRLQAAASEEISERMRKSLDLMMDINGKQDTAERRGGDRGRGGEEGDEDDDSERQGDEEDSEQKDLDREEAQKIKREREQLLEDMKLPPLDVILRAPIEVWVSSGKAFVSPEVVESKEENRRKKRQFRSQVCLALDIDKHVLRQMKGRRLEQRKPGTYKSTLSSTQPVVIEKHWQQPTVEEQDKHHSVHKLQSHLGEIKANQNEAITGFSGINLDGKLYEQPNMKRVMVYPNGESMERSVYVWGNTIDEILESATQKLGLWRQARLLYNLEGKKIENFDEIQRDQLVCVSTGKSFMQTNNERVNIEVKANWGRARKQYGSRATDVVVDVLKNPEVDVDPFGPPLMALPDSQPKITK